METTVMTNKEAYDAAVRTFSYEAENLSDEQILVLKSVDDCLARRAEAKRADSQKKAAKARHLAAIGSPPEKTKTSELMADATVDCMTLALVDPRQRIKVLEGSNSALQQKVQALETMILELQARFAETHAGR